VSWLTVAYSLLLAPLPDAWGLSLGEDLGSATMALFAADVRLVTVAGARNARTAAAPPKRCCDGSRTAAHDEHCQRRSRTTTTRSPGEDRMSFSQNRDVTHFSPENSRVWSL